MTDLWHSLHKSEYSYLKIIADQWDLPFDASDAKEGIDQLAEALLDGHHLSRITEILSPQEQEVLVWVDDLEGKVPWDQLTRKFGQVREMGAGRLDRERPDKKPISTTERLWYRALIARGFFETDIGPQEFAYIPDDLREAIMPALNPDRDSSAELDFMCRKAAPREREVVLPAPLFILDKLCTFLAGLRTGIDPSPHLPSFSKAEEDFFHDLTKAAGLLEERGQLSSTKIRDFLDLDDPEGLRFLWEKWLSEEMSAEIYLLPEIQVEGEPPVEADRIREQLLSYLGLLPPDEWWSIESFVTQVKEKNPDILRSGGEYDAWFIKEKSTDAFLKGFDYWDEIEGALLRFFIAGPMYWLGLVDLGAQEEEASPLAFTLTPLFSACIARHLPTLPARKLEQVRLRSQGEIRITENVPRKARYQIARFCDWYPIKADAYHYRLSPQSLTRAEDQDLRVPHLLTLFKNHAEAIPPNLLAALERWDKSGSQASIEPRTVLRLGSPAILKALKKSSANRYIVEQLGPTAVIIHPDSEEKVSQALMELGFFVALDQSDSQT
jgi:hypothetical protein